MICPRCSRNKGLIACELCSGNGFVKEALGQAYLDLSSKTSQATHLLVAHQPQPGTKLMQPKIRGISITQYDEAADMESLAPTTQNRFVISSLRWNALNQHYTMQPRRLYSTREEAERECRKYMDNGQPMYVLEIIVKVELAPPPSITTEFRPASDV